MKIISDSLCECSLCGRVVDLWKEIHPQDIIDTGLCPLCQYWGQAAKDQDNRWVINGQLFELHIKKEQNLEDDDLEELRYIITPETVLVADSLYNYGKIPDEYLHLFHNQARFINKNAFKRIFRRINYRCHNKGCWSRRNCWWYRDDAGYNKIPRRKNLNPENCPMFIQNFNKNKKS